ncbi:MAG: hypothetical protein P4M15_08640 [Alphaproteobacteria bacterium]|nr:hypothetical protein [Alphaproteobacteria bacterium]
MKSFFRSRAAALILSSAALAPLPALAQVGGGVGGGGQNVGVVSAYGAPPVLSGCGASPTVTPGSNSNFGTINSSTAAAGCTLTWQAYAYSPTGNLASVAYTRQSVPVCILSSRTAGSLITAVTVVNTTTLTFTAAGASGVYDYICIGS